MIRQRIKLRNTQYAVRNTSMKGAALLVVLFVIMAITILSLGFLSRSDVELSCGQNMILRTQMDYLAESGLEHAKGLILNPQDIEQEYWMGATDQQLVEGCSDYYNVRVVRDENETTDYCNYNIECDAYRQKGSETVGRSSLKAKLRLDPCIALWLGSSTTLWNVVKVYGDVYCKGNLINQGTIDGDVFILPNNFSGNNPKGQKYAVADLSLSRPNVTVNDFKDRSDVVDYRPIDSTLTGNVSINRMLLVDANLTVSGTGNKIATVKNLPALYVTKDLIIEEGASLEIKGLAVIDGNVLIKEKASLNVLGGLFIQGTLSGTNASVTIAAEPSKTAIITWSEGTPQKWGQAAGAFFRSIRRQ